MKTTLGFSSIKFAICSSASLRTCHRFTKTVDVLGFETGFVVPRGDALREVDTSSLDCVGDYRRGRVVGLTSQGITQLGNIVSIDFHHCEAECSPLINERFKIPYFGDGSVGLKFVVVDYDGQIAVPMMARRNRGLPNRALIDFSVADYNEDSVLFAADASCLSHSDTN